MSASEEREKQKPPMKTTKKNITKYARCVITLVLYEIFACSYGWRKRNVGISLGAIFVLCVFERKPKVATLWLLIFVKSAAKTWIIVSSS